MEASARSSETSPKDTPLAALSRSLYNASRSIQLYATEVATFRQEYDREVLEGDGPGTPHLDTFHEIDSRIGEIRAMETQLVACRVALQEFRNWPTVLVPISRLPPECISQIFLMGSNPVDQEDPDVDQSPSCPPRKPFCLTVSTVCHRWRDIALSTPRLWSNIEFLDVPLFKYSELMLERSRGCPLYIRVHPHLFEEQYHITLHILRRYISDRDISVTVKKIAYPGDTEFVINQLINRGESPPRITELILAGEPKYGLLRSLIYPEGFDIAAPLGGVRYLSVAATYLPRCIIPAYADLVELRLSGIIDHSSTDLSQLEEILRSCHRLVFLRASNVGGSDIPPSVHSRDPVVLRSLQTIEIVDAYDASVNYFLRTLVAPALDALRIQGKASAYDDNLPAPEIGEALAIFLATSNPHLRSVSLDAVEIPRDDLVPMLEHLPHISSLRLSRMHGISRFLEALSSERLCLQLESLVVANIIYGHHAIFAPLRALIQPEDRPPLQRLIIRECKDFNPSDIAWLSANAPSFILVSCDGLFK
ncbi:hypothetical protein BOTBODRAFT_433778 [Botryobasidium botryosum FD-172 SS1]|uniref:F-box domain-containing protein n=1 Tax=Botryobasidium botryosum (strain FD-172 SS1) TaxID=930990 RepID=A0A067MU46_BOTB1|nr:hypothetical protein BOTBODRAFT_433778 [Botryobasidium botryosum FD-172 SS1]